MFGNMKLFLVLNTISHSFALLTRDIPVNTQNKFHISAHPCIILYLIYIAIMTLNKMIYISDSRAMATGPKWTMYKITLSLNFVLIANPSLQDEAVAENKISNQDVCLGEKEIPEDIMFVSKHGVLPGALLLEACGGGVTPPPKRLQHSVLPGASLLGVCGGVSHPLPKVFKHWENSGKL